MPDRQPSALPSRSLDRIVEGAVNLRDLGGLPTGDGGRVRTGRLLRSGLTHAITPAGISTLREGVGLRTVIDFRDAAERQQDGAVDWAAHGIVGLHLPPLSEAAFLAQQQAPLAQQQAPRDTVEAWKKAMRGDRFERRLYRDLVDAEPGRRALRRFLERLAEPTEGATLYHCSGGRDRTGVATALVLTVLGVNEDIICEDYALTSAQLRPHTHHFANQMAAFDLTDDEWIELTRCRPASMAGFLDDLRTKYGSPLGYVETIGVRQETLSALRAALLA